MAQKVTLVDDLDKETEGAKTIRFSVDDKAYEIDLAEKNTERFHTVLQEFIDAARVVDRTPAATPAPSRQTRRRSPSDNQEEMARIREWAIAEGKGVKKRGRIKQEYIDEYRALHRGTENGQGTDEAGVQEEHESSDER